MEKLNLKAITAGAVVAVLAGTLVGLVAPTPSGDPTDPGTLISALSGLLAYLPGGYLAGRISGEHGSLNGLSTAVAGLLLGVVVGVFLFAAGLGAGEMPPDSMNATGVAVAGLVSLVLAFVGAYAGGKLGERSAPRHVEWEAGR